MKLSNRIVKGITMLTIGTSMMTFRSVEAKSAEPVVIRFAWWGSEYRNKATMEAIKIFEKKNPEIKIMPELLTSSSMFEKLTIQFAGGSAPDIMQMNWAWLHKLGQNSKNFYDMSKLDEIDLSYFDKEALKNTTVNGKISAIPVSSSPKVFYFNDEFYKKAGIDYPKSFDDMFEKSKIIKEKLGPDHYAMILTPYDAMLIALYYTEGKFGKPFIKNNKVNLTTEELAEAFKMYTRMIDEGVVNSPENLMGEGMQRDRRNSWIEGKHGGIYEWTSAIPQYNNALKTGKLEPAEFLKMENKAGLSKISMVFGMNNKTKHPKETAKFLNALFTDEDMVKALGTTRGVPLNSKTFEILEKNGMFDEIIKRGDDLYKGNEGVGMHYHFEAAEMQKLYNDSIEEMTRSKEKNRELKAAKKIIDGLNDYMEEQGY